MQPDSKIPMFVSFSRTTGTDLIAKLESLRTAGFCIDSVQESLGTATCSVDPQNEASLVQVVNQLGGIARRQRVFHAV